jgi:translation initiation factor IF-3
MPRGGLLINRDSRGLDNRPKETRINERIRAREVRVIDENGEQIGIMVPMRALDLARERNLDLVEISPMANPPVCKIMDYGRFKYESAKRDNDARKRQKTSEVKEIRLHAHTDTHDIEVRVKKIFQFLADGDKVKVSIQFRGREVFHPEIGRQMLESIVTQLKGAATIERSPMLEGRNMWMMLSRAPGWEPAKKATDTPAEAAPVGAPASNGTSAAEGLPPTEGAQA